MATKDSNHSAVPGTPRTVGDEGPSQGGAHQGAAPLTAMPTTSASQLAGATGPAGGIEESVADDTAQATTRAGVDGVFSFFINLAFVVPALPLMISTASYAPVRGITIIIVVIALTGWAWGARFKRSQVISLRTRDYITSARFAGDGPFRIIF